MLVDDLEEEVARRSPPALLREMGVEDLDEKLDKENTGPTHLDEAVICAMRDEKDDEKIAWFLKRHAQRREREIYEELLLELLGSTNTYVKLKAGEVLSFLYVKKAPSAKFNAFVADCLEITKPSEVPKQAMVLVQRVLERRENKEFYINDKFVCRMHTLLSQKELQYNALLLIWILSFEKRAVAFLRTHDIPGAVIDIAKEQSKEKVLRLCCLILVNLCKFGFRFSIARNSAILDSIGHAEEKTKDEELLQCMETLKGHLLEVLQKGSLIENYFAEIFENRLDDSACHFDPGFWTANAGTLVAKKVEIIKALKKHLRSHNTKFICLAANDIHMLLKYVPDVYFYVERLKIKDDLVELSMSDNSDVSFYAVKALATCIFAEWS